jgi:hypothetical protein
METLARGLGQRRQTASPLAPHIQLVPSRLKRLQVLQESRQEKEMAMEQAVE